MSFKVKRWIQNTPTKKTSAKKNELTYEVHFALKTQKDTLVKKLASQLLDWQLDSLKSTDLPFYSFQIKNGFLYVGFLPNKGPHPVGAEESLTPSEFSLARDFCGIILRSIRETVKGNTLHIHVDELKEIQIEGLLTGLEIGSYQYRQKDSLPAMQFLKNGAPFSLAPFEKALHRGFAVNVARHLTNLPPNELNPESFSQWFVKEWKTEKNWSVEVFNHERLKKDGYALLLAVGNSALNPPAMVHLKYRGSKNPKSPTHCLIGKGITFDSGGLDIKPPAGMRFMKKDMGGAACLAGVALYLKENPLPINCDFYFALAENAVDERAFRPGDVYFTKNGMSVEISNTDAEGRLVLADAFICAQLQNKNPKTLINVATLTGAGKVALGTDVASLFSNNLELCEKLKTAARESGDPCWHMPLVHDYGSMFQTPFADMVNSIESSFGGSITAALFLNKFVENGTPWAHFDIYAWQEGNKGPYLERGGSGQTTQCLIQFLENSTPNE